jgi:hypothetical protein
MRQYFHFGNVFLLACLLAVVGCNRSNDTAISQAKADAEAALDDAVKEKARADSAAAELVKQKTRADAAEVELAKLKAVQPQVNPVGDSRKAAEWILSISGIVKVVAEDKLIEVHGPDGKLPSGEFEITEIWLPNKVMNNNIKIISGLKSVLLVNIPATKLTEFTFLKGMNNIRTFNGLDTDLDDASLGYLKDCPKLESLSAGTNFQNHVTDDGIQNLKDMKFLVYLDILGTRATDLGLGHIKGLTNLKYLAMGNQGIKTDITDAGIAHIAGMKKLETLIVVNAAVTDAGLEHVKKLSNLKRLHLAKTNVTEAGAASLKTALPNCKVEYTK